MFGFGNVMPLGRRLVDCFELDRGESAEAALFASAVVGAFDPDDDRQPEVIPGRPALTVEHVLEAVHVCVDDTSRVAYVEVLPDQKAITCIGFLDRAIAWFAERGIMIERVMTDNGSGYVSKLWAAHCRQIEVRHLRTKPYRPRTNGKAERFIQTMLREWAYAAVYQTSDQRHRALGPWVWRYNHQRLHSALGHKTPISRLHSEDEA